MSLPGRECPPMYQGGYFIDDSYMPSREESEKIVIPPEIRAKTEKSIKELLKFVRSGLEKEER